MRTLLLSMMAFVSISLAACGGGGSSGTSSSATAAAAPASAASTPAAAIPASAPIVQTPTPAPTPTVVQSTTANVQPITVGAIATGTRNMLQTSVTICAPGTSTCQTIGNIQVDTGSQGLRLVASVLSPALTQALPAVTDTAGAQVASCAIFGSGYTWGSLRSADIRMAGEVAGATSIQLIGDPGIPGAPADCAASGASMQTATALRSNGILGVGPFMADCGAGCATNALPRWYYGCSSATCASESLPTAQQVTNPVSRFASDNNGVVIELPAVPDLGASSVTGTLTFGIGSQANNALGGAQVLKSSASTGFVSTTFQGAPYSSSYIDSGSNGLFLTLASATRCGFWFCPATTQTFTATLNGVDGSSANATFTIGNSTALFGSGNNALGNLAGPGANVFDWGLPFFYGRRVFTAIEAQVTPSGTGPFYAF